MARSSRSPLKLDVPAFLAMALSLMHGHGSKPPTAHSPTQEKRIPGLRALADGGSRLIP